MVDDESDVDILENPFRYDVVEICLHVLIKYVDIFVIIGSDGLEQLDDIGML